MSEFGEMLGYLLKDHRTKKQKRWDRICLYGVILLIPTVLIGIGILIGKFIL